MADLDADFEAAVANSRKLPQRPDNPTLLKIYGLYKQATVGDNAEKKPQDETNETPQSNKEDFVHYLLERPILLLLLDREDVVRSRRSLYFRLRSELAYQVVSSPYKRDM